MLFPLVGFFFWEITCSSNVPLGDVPKMGSMSSAPVALSFVISYAEAANINGPFELIDTVVELEIHRCNSPPG